LTVIAAFVKLRTFTGRWSTLTAGSSLPKPEPTIVMVTGVVEKSAVTLVILGVTVLCGDG
jgi:hypothetical protein